MNRLYYKTDQLNLTRTRSKYSWFLQIQVSGGYIISLAYFPRTVCSCLGTLYHLQFGFFTETGAFMFVVEVV